VYTRPAPPVRQPLGSGREGGPNAFQQNVKHLVYIYIYIFIYIYI
jgi:hypothetical protein